MFVVHLELFDAGGLLVQEQIDQPQPLVRRA
jgi:hypothetical protein